MLDVSTTFVKLDHKNTECYSKSGSLLADIAIVKVFFDLLLLLLSVIPAFSQPLLKFQSIALAHITFKGFLE